MASADPSVVKVLMIMAQLTGKTFASAEPAELLAADLADYPAPAVLVALARCRKELRSFPTLADILARIEDGRPGAEEAWAMIPRDEDGSVVWTSEMAEAFGTARRLLPDEVAARMAFRETYLKLLADARAERRPARWEVSLGMDKNGRVAALQEAVRKKRIGQDQAQALLPDFDAPIARLQLVDGRAEGQATSDLTPVRDIAARIAARAGRQVRIQHQSHVRRMDKIEAEPMTDEEIRERLEVLRRQVRRIGESEGS